MSWLDRFLSRWLQPVPDEAGQAPAPFSLEIEFLPAQRVVKISARGLLTVEGNDQLVAAAIAAGRQYDTQLFLVDDRNVEVAMNFANLYDLPDHNRQLGVTPAFRVALLFTPSQRNSDIFKFYENRIVITDFQQRVFTDEEPALAWLLEAKRS